MTEAPSNNGHRTPREIRQRADVVVVGGGLAGLTAAATAARAGARVALIEARGDLGGRARSEEVEGFTINHGAHALYRAGRGTAVLAELGVRPKGGIPRQGGLGWWKDGARVPARHLAAAGGTDALRAVWRLLVPRGRRGESEASMADWLDRNVPDGGRDLAEMLIRTSCYAADMANLDAGSAVQQLARGARGVLYLHGGWQSLVSGLEGVARAAGVEFVSGRVEAVRSVVGVEGGQAGPGEVHVEVRGGETLTGRAVVLAAGGPGHADSLLGGASAAVAGWAAAADPITAACLDVAVAGSPRRRPSSMYGLGSPVYAVDHARTARLAPDGGAMHHALFYEPDRAVGVDHRAVLESLLDAHDPGWQDRAVSVVFRKRSVVAHDRVQPGRGGRHPTVAVADLGGVFVAGDWLTGHGMLADAPLTAGAEAGRAAAALSSGAHRSGVARVPV